MKGTDQTGPPGQLTPATSAGSAPPPFGYPMYPGPPRPSLSLQSISLPDFSDDQFITPSAPSYSSVPTASTAEPCLTLTAKAGLNPVRISSSAGLREVPCMATLTGISRSIDEIELARTGTDLVCVIDVSGSMNSDGKIEMVKQSLSFIVDNLCGKDRISLVIFDDRAQRLCPLTVCDEAGRFSLQSIIPTIHTNGSTNIEFGLKLGLKVLQDRRIVNNLSALFLLSDGQDTCGNNPLARCRSTLTAGQRQGGGVLVHTFGFGRDHDSALMSALAEEGGGGFQYVEQLEGIAGAFASSFGGVVSVVAREVEVRVTANAGEEVPCALARLYVRTGLDHFSLPFITANEHKDLVFLLSLPSPILSSPITISPFSLQLTYKDATGVQQHQEAILKLTLSPDTDERMEEDVYINWYRVKGSEALAAAREQANAGRLEEAREGLAAVLAEMEAAQVKEASLVKQMRGDVQESLLRLRDVQTFQSGGSAHISSLSSNHYYQYTSPITQVYSTIQQVSYTIRSSQTVPDYFPPTAQTMSAPARPLQMPKTFNPPEQQPGPLPPFSPHLPSTPMPSKFGIPSGVPKFGPSVSPPLPMANVPKFGPPPFQSKQSDSPQIAPTFIAPPPSKPEEEPTSPNQEEQKDETI